MANTIKIKRSSTASDEPTASDLDVGELAVNTADGKLFTKHTDNSIVEISGGSGGGNADTLDSLDSTQFLRSDAADTKTSGDLTFSDNVKAEFGNNRDLRIYHSGSNSIIADFGTGDLKIGGTNLLLTKGDTTETFFKGVANAQVELYYDNNKKLETTSTGATVTGTLVADAATINSGVAINNASGFGNIEVGGTSGAYVDLKNPNSDDYDIRLTTTGTGGQFLSQDALRIGSTGTTSITNVSGNSTYANFIPAGAVELFYSGNKRLETTSTGATVTGTLVADGLDLGDNEKIRLGASQDLEIFHDGSHSRIAEVGQGNLKIQASTFQLINAADTEYIMQGLQDGAVELYYNGTKRIETTSTGATVTGSLTVSADSFLGAATVRNWNNSDTDIDGLLGGSTFGNIIEGQNSGHFVLGIRENDTTDGLYIISGGGNYATDDTYDTAVATFRCGGNVGIGTTSPSQKLEVNGTIKIPTGSETGTRLQVGDDIAIFDDGNAHIHSLSSHLWLNAADGASSVRINNQENGDVLLTNGTGSVGIGTNSPSTALEVVGDLTLTSTDGGATNDPQLILYRNSASPAPSDELGEIIFKGRNDASQDVNYSIIEGAITDETDGTEDGQIKFRSLIAGADALYLQMSSGFNIFYRPLLLKNEDIVFEGSTEDDFETTLTVTDPTADRTITLPDATGTVLLNTGNQSITGDLTVTSTDDGATEDPTLKLFRNSASPTGGDSIGHIQFTGNNASATEIVLAEIEAVLGGTTAGSEEGRMRIKVNDGGTEFTVIEIGYDRVQFNEAIMINNGRQLGFEGANVDAHETSLRATEPTQDNDITLPDASGTVLLDTGDQTITGDLTVTSTDAGSTVNPSLILHRDSASPADFDVIGNVQFDAENSAGEQTTYAQIYSQIVDQTDGTEDGYLQFWTKVGGTDLVQFRLGFSTADFFGNVRINTSNVVSDPALIFEGSTANDFETFFKATDPTADNTITLPDASGTVALQEQAYQSINAQTGTTYTTVLADGGKLVTLSNASAITLTIPPNSSVAYPVGTKLDFIQIGAGQVTVAGGTGVTVNSTPTLKFRTQHSGASCIKIATDTWQLVGDLAES